MNVEPFKSMVIVNPRSNNGRTGKMWGYISKRLHETLGRFDHAFTTGPGHATRLAAEALSKGYEMIVSVGGDGTHSETASGFFDGRKPINPDGVLAIVTSGTGGDFRRTFGFPAGPDGAMKHLAGRKTVPLDAGTYTCTAYDGSCRTGYFVNILSFGIAGLVDHLVNNSSKALGGKISFIIGTLRATAMFRAQTVNISLDGGPPRTTTIHNMAVANGRFFGGGMMVAPKADPSDGLFDIVGFEGMDTLRFLGLARSIYKGRHLSRPGVTFSRATKVQVTSLEPVLIDADGEQPGMLPLSVEILPNALRLKV